MEEWGNLDFILFSVLLVLFVYVFAANQITTLHKLYLTFHVCMMIWPLSHFLVTMTTNHLFQQAVLKMAFISLSLIGFGWLWFTRVLVRGMQSLKWKTVMLSAIPLFISTLLIIANPGQAFYRAEPGYLLDREYGPLFWVVAGFGFIYCVAAFVTLYKGIRQKPSTLQRNQMSLFAAGIGLILFFVVLDTVLNVLMSPEKPVYGMTSIGLFLSDLCFIVSIQRYNAFEIIDVALRDVLRNMKNGVAVVDTQNIVLEANPSMKRFLTVRIGEPLDPENDPLVSGETELVDILRNKRHPFKSVQFEHSYHGKEDRHVVIQISPIHNRKKVLLGHVITIQDVTELRSLIRKLNSKNAELRRQNKELTLTQKKLYVANRRLEEMAIKDSLTGCYNRRYLNQYLEREIIVSRRYSRSFSILLFDIDLFKNINDTYGHLIGDEVLRSTARTVMKCLRKSDMLARYGGEEFTVYLPETAEQDAVMIAQRIRDAVEQNQVQTPKGPISVTVSMGVAACHQSTMSTVDPKELLNQLFARADAALYRAKQQGRNRIIAG